MLDKMTTVESKDESKDEISDTDSGIILHSGPDSPTSPVKDLTTHTRALKMKHQVLEDRLELCLLELRKLCIREAELTGKMSPDYPLMPDEKPPRVRRRIGAAFKLDEGLIHQHGENSELQGLEADLALQLQIYEAARKLSLEENLSKPQKKSRLQQCKREERKVKELQAVVSQHRNKIERSSLQTTSPTKHKDLSMSDDSSLSDAVGMDDDMDSSGPLSAPALNSPYADPLQSASSTSSLQSSQQSSSHASVEYEHSPIKNSPWKESSLDQPYWKPAKPQSACSSRSNSPVGTPVLADNRVLPCQFIKNMALRHNHSSSAPSTPELHVRRQYSQSFRLSKSKPSPDMEHFSSANNRGRTRLQQRRCAADFMARFPEYSPQQHLYQSSSEDSSSDHSASSYTSSPSRDGPTEIPKLCPPPYGFHFGAQHGPSNSPRSPASGMPPRDANQPQASPSYCKAVAGDLPLSPQEMNREKRYLSPPPPVSRSPQHRQWQEGTASPKSMLKPPPPYNRLVRTPSLREYPNHASRMMPREMVSEELKSWHQRNQFHKSRAASLDRQGSYRVKSPASPQLPPYKQGSGNVILQRAADGTPVQWYVEEDAEIVSQV